ncbi:MAG: aldehyde ferredoxin oxidoreductase C-terminal domain-containing protein [Candidatus Woesearchaeota archaeon]
MIEQTALIIDASTQQWDIKKIRDPKILGPVDFGFYMSQKSDYFCMGQGLLAGSPIPGTHRLVFTGKSPIWGTFYTSSMGGAAEKFKNLGINYIAIKNAFPTYSILRITNFANHLEVNFESVENIKKIWESHQGLKGVYALQKYVLSQCGECPARQICDSCRAVVAGPASLHTKIGALASTVVAKGELTGVDCWAGRGGIGSNMVQRHNLVAIVFGGDHQNNRVLHNLPLIDQIFMENLGKKMMPAVTQATVKYRFDPDLNSGGTFGCNVTKLRDWLLMLNWSSIYWPNEKRLEIYTRLVQNHYLKQFNEETIQTKSYRNCGEPCPALCKKMRAEYKKDYEPYEALGPNCGIFDQRAAEEVNHHVDSLGFDAIQVGNTVSWIMELIENKIIPKQELGLTLDPRWSLDSFDVVNDSMHNAKVAIEIIDMIMSEKGAVFQQGIRQSAKALDKKYGTQTIHKALYTPNGDKFCMAPNQYWVPAFFIPMPIQGKYYEDYTADFKEPYELGLKSADRMIKELYSENGGICRFHRKWSETVVQPLVNQLYNENYDFYQHHKALSNAIDQQDYKTEFWESDRVVDVIVKYLEKLHAADPQNEALSKWVAKFQQDKWKAAREYWDQVSNGISEGLKL